jgi:hypothetical protein
MKILIGCLLGMFAPGLVKLLLVVYFVSLLVGVVEAVTREG